MALSKKNYGKLYRKCANIEYLNITETSIRGHRLKSALGRKQIFVSSNCRATKAVSLSIRGETEVSEKKDCS